MTLPAIFLAATASLGAVAFSVRCRLGVDRAAPVEASAVARELASGRVDLPRLADQLARAGCSPATETPATTPARLVADLNEHLRDVDGLLRRAEPVPFAAARVALFSGACAAVLELPRVLARGASPLGPVVPFVIGAVGAAVSWDLGGRVIRRTKAIRAEWDELGRALSRLLATSPELAPPVTKAASLGAST